MRCSAIYWCSAAWQWLRLKEDRFDDVMRKIDAGRRVRVLTLTGILSGLATLVNPYGFQLHVHIYRYLSNRFLMDHIDEFQSPNFHYVAQKCFAGLLLLTLVALVTRKRETSQASISQVLVVLFAVYAGLYASRNIPVSALLLILVIGPWLSETMERFADRRLAVQGLASTRFLQRMEAIEFSLRGHLWPIVAIVLSCWIAAHGGKLGAKTLMDAHFDGKRFPVAAVNYLKEKDVPGPVVSPDSWGGYLIYRFYPERKVVVDDRHDFYGEEFLKSYLKMVHVEPGWQDFLRQNAAHCVVVPKDSALANILAETAGWKAIYSDDVAVVFVPTPARPEVPANVSPAAMTLINRCTAYRQVATASSPVFPPAHAKCFASSGAPPAGGDFLQFGPKVGLEHFDQIGAGLAARSGHGLRRQCQSALAPLQCAFDSPDAAEAISSIRPASSASCGEISRPPTARRSASRGPTSRRSPARIIGGNGMPTCTSFNPILKSPCAITRQSQNSASTVPPAGRGR